MALTWAKNTRVCHDSWNLRCHVILLLAPLLAGCHNTCFTFTSNPPTSTINIKASNPPPTCTLAKANVTVRLQLAAQSVCSSCPESGQVQHIFLSIQGIEVHASPTADNNSPDWQELLPAEVIQQPLQVHLVSGTDNPTAAKSLGDAVAIPAGIYSQVRLRFVPNPLEARVGLPETNGCGSGLFNCVVAADGRIHPLLSNPGSPELRVTSDRIEGGSFFVPPDTDTDLLIELQLAWVLSSTDHDIRLLPALAGNAKVARISN